MICCRKECGKELPDGALYCPACGKKQMKTAAPKVRKRPNGDGTAYKRGSTWTAQYRVYLHGSRVSEKTKGGFASRAAALDYLHEMRSGATAQETQMRVVEAWSGLQATQKYLSLSKDKQSHYRTAWSRLASVQYRVIGTIPFRELQALVDAAPGDFYAKRDMKALLGKLWEVAIKNSALRAGDDNTGTLELPPVPGSTRDAFTVDEVRSMWTAYEAGNLTAAYGLIMCYTGMRHGELVELDCKNIDLKRQVLIGGIKTAAGKNREIPLATALLPVMRDALSVARFGLLNEGEASFYEHWHEMLAAAGIREHMTPHSCRHTLASAMESAKVSPITRKLILGHAIHDITEQYTHVRLPDKLAAVNLATAPFAPVAARLPTK